MAILAQGGPAMSWASMIRNSDASVEASCTNVRSQPSSSAVAPGRGTKWVSCPPQPAGNLCSSTVTSPLSWKVYFSSEPITGSPQGRLRSSSNAEQYPKRCFWPSNCLLITGKSTKLPCTSLSVTVPVLRCKRHSYNREASRAALLPPSFPKYWRTKASRSSLPSVHGKVSLMASARHPRRTTSSPSSYAFRRWKAYPVSTSNHCSASEP
mmetsp:Transcript_31337/g.93300  ORF Transcript_31337/g.93300 Transcript_31337/m.93300 type:complete len:210 (+) Transcript_31337:378-1007(+)